MVWSAKRLMQYILHYTTWLFSKLDLLKYICEKPYISSQIARWQALLTEYDIVYMTRKDVKGSVIADQLTYNALEDYMPLNFDLLDEDVLVVDGDGEMND